MDKMLDEMTTELRKDFMAFKRVVGELDTARARVKPLKDRLQRAEAFLLKMDADPVPAALTETRELARRGGRR